MRLTDRDLERFEKLTLIAINPEPGLCITCRISGLELQALVEEVKESRAQQANVASGSISDWTCAKFRIYEVPNDYRNYGTRYALVDQDNFVWMNGKILGRTTAVLHEYLHHLPKSETEAWSQAPVALKWERSK